ncbi:MAG: glycosyltransferase [Thermoproteota archaeon]|jgi:glycosyltransferase involved in cell wall biosynthesis
MSQSSTYAMTVFMNAKESSLNIKRDMIQVNQLNKFNISALLPMTSTEFLLKYSHWEYIINELSNIFSNLIILADSPVTINNNITIKTIKLPVKIRESRFMRYLYVFLYTLWGILNINKYTLIIALSGGPAAISSLILKILTKKPIITIVRTDFTEYRAYPGLSHIERLFYLLHEILMRKLIMKSNKVIAIYEHLYLLIRSLGISNRKCKLIYLPADRSFFECQHKNNNDFIVGFVGRFSYENGSDLFIKVAECVYHYDPSIRFLYVGDMPQNMPHLPNVITTGFIEHNKVPSYLSQMDVFLSLKRSKGIPVAVIEALACGVPVIGINITDQILSGVIIKINNHNDEKETILRVCQQLLKLKNEKEKLKQLSYNIKNIAQTYFSMQKFINDFKSVISDIITEELKK